MTHLSQTAMSPSPRVFKHSLDWRFLLPLADPQKTCLLFEENTDLSQALEQVGIHVSNRLSLSELRDRKQERFQLLIMPFGLPSGWAGTGRAAQVQFYFSIRHFIDPGGQLLMGFNHVFNVRARPRANYHPSTPRRLAGDLMQAGFRSVKMYGAMPNLEIPEYILDLDPRAIAFALRNRFRRKPVVLRSLHLLARIIGWKSISTILPCYFAVAVA